MGTLWLRSFTGGLDARRLPETSPGGTLIYGKDGHINRGGEFEQRADFIPVYELPAGETKGLAATKAGLWVFGHQASVAGLPSGVNFRQIPHPSGEALAEVKFVALFRGRVQSIGYFIDGATYVFNNSNLITDALAPPNLDESGTPTALLTAVQKLHIASDDNLFFSAIADSTDYGSGSGIGAGVIAMSTTTNGSEELIGLAPYGQYVAVFAKDVIQVWYMDPDDTLNKLAQTLANTGARAPRSITPFGDGDVFYLDSSGIRSLRARANSAADSAYTTDIGSPVDDLVAALLETLPDETIDRAIGITEPRDGRFWLAIGSQIYVFSYFPQAKVSGWTIYEPGFDIDDMVVWNRRVWLRSGDTIYAYGGEGPGYEYSADVAAEAWSPYLDGEKPGQGKTGDGIDVAVRGEWELRVGMDPVNENASDLIARVDRSTFTLDRIPFDGHFTHISLRFRALAPPSSSAPAKLSSAVVHFTSEEGDDN